MIFDLSDKIRVSNKTENIDVKVFNVIIGFDETKKSVKHISCYCKYRFDDKKCDYSKNRIMKNFDVTLRNQ